jgi:hypothetical protein
MKTAGLRTSVGRRARGGAAALLVCASLMPLSAALSAPGASGIAHGKTSDPLVLAYYYIWHTPGGWERAKTDYPLLGRYASSDPVVVAEHIREARAAGIDGFIVSWKHEPRLDAPLAVLVEEARRQDFKLVLLYEGLDFARNALDNARIASDLQWFADAYADNAVFDTFGKTAVVWSGTWKFSVDQISAVRAAIGAPQRMLLLGSERSAKDYQAKAGVLDGNAYYWSSADPQGTPGYDRRLGELSDSVIADGGLWIAPAAPGFDARLVGGTSIVPRRGGETYRLSWLGALRSYPSAIGIISWNEFSENSQIEPSHSYADEYLRITAALTGQPIWQASELPTGSPRGAAHSSAGPVDPALDSSELPGPRFDGLMSSVVAVVMLVAFGVIVRVVRRRPA